MVTLTIVNQKIIDLGQTVYCQSEMERLGYRLKCLRKSLGLGQGELADQLGELRSNYNAIENCRRPIGYKTLYKLAAHPALGLDMETLTDWKAQDDEILKLIDEGKISKGTTIYDPSSPPDNNNLGLDPAGLDVLARFEKLPQHVQEELLQEIARRKGEPPHV